MEASPEMSTTDQIIDVEVAELDPELRLTLDMDVREAEALRIWLLKPAADGTTALDDPLVNGALSTLGRTLDAIRAAVSVRREYEQAAVNIGHLSDEQVLDLGRRVSAAAQPRPRG
jgi:hypothetical protein